jgi:heme-degrading monooxygenase HmoA
MVCRKRVSWATLQPRRNPLTRPDPGKVTTIDPAQPIVTLINVFTVKVEDQDPFIKAQTGEYKRLWRKIPGSLAANLHRGRSGKKAANYAQFRSMDEMRAWQKGDLMKDHLAVIQPYVERAQPGLYRVIEAISRDGRLPRIEESTTATALIAAQTVAPEPGALDTILAGQRSAVKQLLEDLPGLRSLTIHRGMQPPPPPTAAAGAEPNRRRDTPFDRPLPNAALYAQLESEADGDALLEHPVFRAWFTAEHSAIHAFEAELYTVVYVQNEAAACSAL